MKQKEQLQNLRLIVAQMLDFLEEDVTVYHDLPERGKLFKFLNRYRKALCKKRVE